MNKYKRIPFEQRNGATSQKDVFCLTNSKQQQQSVLFIILCTNDFFLQQQQKKHQQQQQIFQTKRTTCKIKAFMQ